MKTLEKELRAWLRPVSPLTAFAKSLKNEDDPSKSAKGEYIDPLKDEDLSELPDSMKTKLEKLRKDYEESFKTNKTLEERRLQAEQFARGEQSKASKATALLRQHNLDPAAPVVKPNLSDAKHDELVAKFIKDNNLDPKLADTYAKLFGSANEIQRAEIMREVAGPLASNLNELKAASAMVQVQGDFKQVFAIPELAQQIETNVQALLKQKQPVTRDTISHLAKMAWGEYSLDPANADKLKTKETDLNTQVPRFGSAVSQGGHVNNPRKGDDKGPQASQAETVSIIGNLNKLWTADMPKKGKK